MNRRNEDNLIENLVGDFEYEVQVPYLLYRNASQEVNCIWFYNPRECEEVDNLFQRILSAYAKVPTKLKLPCGKSEFEELETVPTMAVMEGPLESSSATTSEVVDAPAPDNPFFTNFFSGTMTLKSNASATIPPHPPSFPPSISNVQIQTPSAPNIFHPLMYNPENSHLKRTANLVTPSFFNPPILSFMPTAPSIDPSNCLQRPYGTPLLQPFPPPTPSLSLSPLPPTANYRPVTSKDEVRKVILTLVQDDQFIDMVHRALLNARSFY